jgi:hypothetical protein
MFDSLSKHFQNKVIIVDKDRITVKGPHRPPFTWNVNEPEYITNRLGPFINFFDQQKQINRRKEQLLQYFIIGLGALIPIINVIGIEQLKTNIASAILGGTIAALTAILQFEEYHERWMSFKQAGTGLTQEYYKWSNCSDEYALRDKNSAS